MEYINGQRSRRKITVLFKRKGQRKNRGDMGKKIRVFSYSVFLLLITLESSFASSLSQSNSNQGIEHSISRNLKEDQSQVPEVHCSRERSRAAWKVIEEYLMPFLEREKYQLSSKCRLHPSNDIFRDQEENKIHVDINEWRCGYCKKIFRAEKYLDQHFDNRHLNLLNISGSKCLADVCGALHCDLVMDTQSRKTKCNPAAAAKNHHLCEDLADSCFPVNQGPPATRLHELFLRQFCDAHTCSGGRKPFSRGGRKHTSIFYLAISILILMFLPIFYLIVYLYQREMRTGGQQLKRISKPGRKPKPS
ncbi:zinc finger family [Olea europaea subsp. europaea]|uniref:Zinc finger family n=1 Tax=Olea europaea subsp. europaea TaxID=158383 RepID=A0A8S0UD58_OLEEU|nr:zinc finger family [Olea europaea subsp. europaea]